MDFSAVNGAIQLVLSVSVPLLVAVVAGGLVAGVLQTVTQIEDPVFGLVSRLAGVVLVLALAGSSFFSSIVEFSSRLWGGMEFYR